MKICIYCKKTEEGTEFASKKGKGEHVIPQFLGRFDLYFGDDVVCKACNNKLSKTEGIYKEGSLAGIHSAIYGIDENKKSSIRIRKNRVSWKFISIGGKLGLFKDMFPFIQFTESKIKPRSVIMLDHKKSKMMHILFIEKYAKYAEKKNKEFTKRKEAIDKFKSPYKKINISLYGNEEEGWTLEKIVNLLNTYGLTYNKKSEERFEDKDRGTGWKMEYFENGDKKTLRTPAKIAFNYFTFCAKEAGMIDIVQNPVFDPIRQYISDGKLPSEEYKPAFNYDGQNKDAEGRHIVTFQKEGDYITSFIKLFGIFSYKIILGKYPFKIQSNNFGCGTGFNPFSKEIINSMYSTPQPIIGKAKYGLFCR